jgi:DNA polymerase-3 subunit epsilon
VYGDNGPESGHNRLPKTRQFWKLEMSIADILKLDQPLVIFDLETTGFNPSIDRIVEVALIKVHPNGNEDEWSSLINPGIQIPKEVTEVHGISNETVTDAPLFAECGRFVFNLFEGCDIGGYNVGFDIRFLTKAFDRLGYDFRPGRIIDGYRIFSKFRSRRLGAAVEHYLGEELEGAHRAMVDTRATLRVLEAQIRKHTLPDTMQEIDSLFNKASSDGLDAGGKLTWRHGEATINFGKKFMSTPLKEVAKDYLMWIMKSDFPDDLKVIIRDAMNGSFPIKPATEEVKPPWE